MLPDFGNWLLLSVRTGFQPSMFEAIGMVEGKLNCLKAVARLGFLFNFGFHGTLQLGHDETKLFDVIPDIVKPNNDWIQLMKSPKVHGRYFEDYVLVPLCNFGNDTLLNCTLFEEAEFSANQKFGQCFYLALPKLKFLASKEQKTGHCM